MWGSSLVRPQHDVVVETSLQGDANLPPALWYCYFAESATRHASLPSRSILVSAIRDTLTSGSSRAVAVRLSAMLWFPAQIFVGCGPDRLASPDACPSREPSHAEHSLGRRPGKPDD